MTHAAHQARRGYDEPPCDGSLLITDRGGPIWMIRCDGCDFTAGLPAYEGSPEARRELEYRQVERFRQQSGIPAALAEWTLERLHVGVKPALYTAACDWAAGKLRGITLSGAAGVGKTTIAAAAADGLLHRQAVRWLSVPALFARLGQGFDDEDRHEVLRLLASPVALVLDDVDKARPTEYAAEQLFLAVDTRVAAGAPLLVTTNLALSELAGRWPEPFGETIASRLGGYCKTFEVQGADRRLERFAA